MRILLWWEHVLKPSRLLTFTVIKRAPRSKISGSFKSAIWLGVRSVANVRVVHRMRSRYDVYVGRPSKWGNPFKIGVHGDRERVIAKYREWLLKQPHLMAALPELRGKILACWCAPASCHADVLSELANE
jgi:hypothetical protein